MHSRGEGNVTRRHRLELRDHKQRNAESQSLKAERGKKQIVAPSEKDCSPTDILWFLF